MDAQQVLEFAELVNRASYSKSQLLFLSKLYTVTQGGGWEKIYKYLLPDYLTENSITEDSILMLIEEIESGLIFHSPDSGSFKETDDKSLGKIIKILTELMPLLMDDQLQVFMLFPRIINYFGENCDIDEISTPSVFQSFDRMMTMLKHPESTSWGLWKRETGLEINPQAQNSGSFLLNLTVEGRREVIRALGTVLDYKGEVSVHNLATLLIEKRVIDDKAIQDYRAELHRKYDESIVLSFTRPDDMPLLNILVRAQIGEIGPVKVLDGYLANRAAEAAKK